VDGDDGGDELHGAEVDDVRGPVFDGGFADVGEFLGHEPWREHDLLLRGGGGQRVGDVGGLGPGVGPHDDRGAGRAVGHRGVGVAGECVVDGDEWGGQLYGAAVDDLGWPVLDGGFAGDQQFLGYGADRGDDVLLRGGGGERFGHVGSLEPGVGTDGSSGAKRGYRDLRFGVGDRPVVDGYHRGVQLHGPAGDHLGRPIHDGWHADDDELREHGADGGDGVLLRGGGGERRGNLGGLGSGVGDDGARGADRCLRDRGLGVSG
jgi:hypothetical protein